MKQRRGVPYLQHPEVFHAECNDEQDIHSCDDNPRPQWDIEQQIQPLQAQGLVRGHASA